MCNQDFGVTLIRSLRLLVVTAAFGGLVHAQSLASYDHTALGEELAVSSCPPLPAVSSKAPLIHPPELCGWSWWFGAIASDNLNGRLYYASGHPCDGIQRINYADIGSTVLPVTYPTPPGFNQVTGMVVDPAFPAGDVLWVISGYEIVQYHVTTGAFMSPVIATPPPGTGVLTGLAWNLSSGKIHAVDENSVIWRFDPLALTFFGGPILPAFPVPARATGIEFCGAGSGPPWVSYFDSTVMQPATGITKVLPSAAGGPRRHHGLAFLGIPFSLGGGSIGGPTLRASGLPGTLSTSFALDFTGHDVGGLDVAFIAIDLTNPATGPAAGPETLMINPSSALVLGPFALSPCPGNPALGCFSLPVSTLGLPPGLAAQIQAASVGPTGARLTNALQVVVFQQ